MSLKTFSGDLELYGASVGQKLTDFFGNFGQNILEGWSGMKTDIVDKIADVEVFPIQKEQFYYKDFKGDPKDVFLHHLAEMGWKDTKVVKWAKELSEMPPEDAFKKVKDISPNLAYQIRDAYFTKKAAWKARPTKESKGQGEILQKYIIAPMPKLIEGAIQKDIGMEKFRAMIERNRTNIYLDYNTSPAISVFQGFVEQLPVVNQVLNFEGPYFDRYREQKGLQVLHGLGALTSLITQLLGISRVLSPFTLPITTGITNLIRPLIDKTGVSRLTRAGVSLMRSAFGSSMAMSTRGWTMGGLRFGLNYGTLTTIQTGINNFLQDKTMDAKDIEKIVGSFALGGAMGGIAGYWRLQASLPWWLRFGGEELMQSAAAATFGLANLFQDQGKLNPGDFWDMFLWELMEVAPENLIPLIIGFGGLGGIGNIADIEGSFSRAMGYAQSAKKTVIRHRFGFTDAKASEHAVDAIVKNIKVIEDGGGKVGPRQMSKLITNYRDQQLKAKTEPGYYDMPIRNKRARELQYYYHVERPKELKHPPDLSDESVEEYVKYMTVHHNVDWEWLVSTGELPDVVQAVKNELITGEAYVGHFAKPEQMRKLYTRLLTRTRMNRTFAKDKALDIDMKSFKKWKGAVNEQAVEVAAKRLARLGDRVILLDDDGKPIGTIRGSKLVDGVMKNWIREHWGQEWDPRLMFNDEYNVLMHELDVWDSIQEGWGSGRIMDLMNLRKDMRDDFVTKAHSVLSDYWAGLPKFMAKYNLEDPYFRFRTAKNEMNFGKQDIVKNAKMILNKAPDLFYRRWPVSTIRNKAFQVLTYGLSTGTNAKRLTEIFHNEGIDAKLEEVKQVLGEFRAWEGSREKSKYFKEGQKTWPIKEGLRLHFDIPRELAIKDYYPFMWRIAQLTAKGDAASHTLAAKFMHNPHEMPRKYLEMPTLKKWMANKWTGFNAFQLYVNRGVKMRFEEGPLKDFARAMDEKPIPVSAHRVLKQWIASNKGVPLDEDVMTANFIVDQMEALNKVPGFNMHLDRNTVNKIFDTSMSIIYSGGLGFKFSAAMKNMFQGPMNMPPGMTMYWWMRGLRKVWTAEGKELLMKNGIWHTMGVEGLGREASTRVGEILRHTLYMFTWVDHYLNRGPVYLGARDQVEYYINKFKGIEGNIHPITDGITRIVQWPSGRPRQWKALGKRWTQMGREADEAWMKWERGGRDIKYLHWKDYADSIVEKIKDEYGFMQQANSNWEYGILGRPYLFGTKPARLAGTFMTWPTWYFGTYIPSLMKFDMPGMLRHIAKAAILIPFFRKYFSMNVRPWLITGPMPMRPYGPVLQTFFSAVEYLKASEYMHAEMKQEALDDLKRSAKVFIPGFYGVHDIVKCFKEMQSDSPYWDDRTGILHYRKNMRKSLSDLMGVTSFYADRDLYLDLMREGKFEEADRIGKKYGMRKVERTPQGIQIMPPGGF